MLLQGSFYGATWGGGTGGPGGGNGLVYKMSTTGAESVLYNFGGPSYGDGAEPNGLIAGSGALYGTTQIGGAANANCANACGTIFRLAP